MASTDEGAAMAGGITTDGRRAPRVSRELAAALAPARELYRSGEPRKARRALHRADRSVHGHPVWRAFDDYLAKLAGKRRGHERLPWEVPPAGRFEHVDTLHFLLVGEEVARARSLIGAGSFDAAEAAIDEALAWAPFFPFAHFLQALCGFERYRRSPAPVPSRPPALAALSAALGHAEAARADPEIEGAPQLVAAIEAEIAAVTSGPAAVAAGGATGPAPTLQQRFEGITREAAGGLTSAAQWRRVRRELRELRTEVRRTLAERGDAGGAGTLRELEATLKERVSELNAMKAEMEELEKVEKLDAKFAALSRRATDDGPSRELDAQLERLARRAEALSGQIKRAPARTALTTLVESVARLRDELPSLSTLRALAGRYEAIMASLQGGVGDLDEAVDALEELERLRHDVRRARVDDPHGRDELRELRKAIDHHVEQLDELTADAREARTVSGLLERFEAVMASAAGGPPSAAQAEELASRLEELRRDARSAVPLASDAVEAVERLQDAIDRNLDQLEQARVVQPLVDEYHQIMESAGDGISSAAEAKTIAGRLAALGRKVERAAAANPGASDALTELSEAVHGQHGHVEKLAGEARRQETGARVVKPLVDQYHQIMESAGDGISSAAEAETIAGRLEALGRKVERAAAANPGASDALTELSEAVHGQHAHVEKLARQARLQETGARAVEPLMKKFDAIMKSADGGITSGDQITSLAERLFDLRRQIEAVDGEVMVSHGAVLGQLRDAVDANLRQLGGAAEHRNVIEPLAERWGEVARRFESGDAAGALKDALELKEEVAVARRQVTGEAARSALRDLGRAMEPLVGPLPAPPAERSGKRRKRRR